MIKIINHKDEFAVMLQEMIDQYPNDINRYTTRLTTTEYAILLQQGGEDIYRWFAMDHRFGAPPRGKAFRSNVRGDWKNIARKRPDNAISKLRQKITTFEERGWETDELKIELGRRQWCLDHGLDWKDPKNKPPIQAQVIPLKVLEA
jgi:hypothetical protein